MLRALAVVLSLSLLAGCITADRHLSSAKLRNAQAAATPIVLGTGY